MATHRTVTVELADRSYPVEIGPGVRHRLARHLGDRVRRVAVVTQASIPNDIDSGRDQRVFTIADGEDAKRLETVEALCRDWATWGLTRNDLVVGLGGGVVTDVAGFAASIYHRGVDVVHIPSSLLGQIDAAIGGKTGVNLPEGKNLVGTFWQPLAVLCDTELLDTLPEREYRAGLGELAKYHFLGGRDLDQLDLADRVTESVRIKAEAVAADEREGGRRALLNYGHTLAHALEIVSGHRLLHGEAVAIGLIYAAEVARLLGRIDDAAVAEHRRVVAGYDLALRPPADIAFGDVAPLFGRDKKALDGVTFVLDGPDGPEIVTGVSTDVLAEAYDRLST